MTIRLAPRRLLVCTSVVPSAFAPTAVSSAPIVNGVFESPGTGGLLQTPRCLRAAPASPGHRRLPSAAPILRWGGAACFSLLGKSRIGLVLARSRRTRVFFNRPVGSILVFTGQTVGDRTCVGSFSAVHGGGNGVNMNWQERYVDVIAVEGLNRLQFFSPLVVPARGAALDAVSIAPIPGPGALAVLALAGLRGPRRR